MSVKVAVRCRPFSAAELQEGEETVIFMEDMKVSARYSGREHTFHYDETLCSVEGAPNMATQETVYEAVAAPLLGHVMTGYNGCIFAYGQTGSGKTYSMVGHDGQRGLIPRITENLFNEIPALQETGVETCVEVSFFEIYNEKVRCLLRPPSGGFEEGSLRIREHPTFGPFVEGLAKFVVSTKEECLQLLEDGSKVRSTASTAMNAGSSRSHAVFTITLTQTKTNGAVVTNTVSKLNLVDLAGSERASRTMATGKRLTEGSNINKSLTCLGKVISSLAESSDPNKEKHIPYRDSVLTWILKDNLGGNSKTVMLATVSPAAMQWEETMSTLRYAERAKKIVNVAVVNESNNNEVIAALQKEIESLQAALKNAAQTDRAALMEEILATEAMKKELDTTMAEKLAETKRMMEEREGYMRELESKLDSQNEEIEALKAANAEKERRILQLLSAIQDKNASNASPQDFEQMRIRVAELEREQNNAKVSIETKTGANSSFADMYDSDLLLGGSSDLENTKDDISLSLVDSDIHLESDDNFDIDLDLDYLMAAHYSEKSPHHVDPQQDISHPPDQLDDTSIHLSLDTSLVLDDESPSVNPTHKTSEVDVIDLDEWNDPVQEVAKNSSVPDNAINNEIEVQTSPELSKNALVSAPLMLPEVLNAVSVQEITSDQLINNGYLDQGIAVVVMFGTVLYGPCELECNFFEKTINILTVHRKIIDQYQASELSFARMDNDVSTRLYMSFYKISKSYTCDFNSTRERFIAHQLLMLIRRNTIMFCPSLCATPEVNLIVHGTTINRGDAVVHVNGDTTLAISRVPYEIYGFWYGCFSLENGQLPSNPAVFHGFLPAAPRDLYIIGTLNVSEALMTNTAIADLFLDCLGREAFYVVETTAGSYLNNACVLTIISRRELVSRIEQVEFKNFDTSRQLAYTGIACRIRINQSSLAVLLVNDAGKKLPAKERNASLRFMSSEMSFGDSSVDAAVKSDYCFVSGNFQYKNEFTEKDEMTKHMKRHNIFSDFHEGAPSPSLRRVVTPTRIFWMHQPSVARLTVGEYSTSRALPSSCFIVGDLFSQRHIVTLFSKSIISVSVEFIRCSFNTRRLPVVIPNAKIRFSGLGVEGSSIEEPLPSRNPLDHIPSKLVVPLCIDSIDFMHLQTITVSLVGSLEESKGVSAIASGIIPLKSTLKRLGEPAHFKVSLYHATCYIGTLQGQVTVLGKAAPQAL